MNAAMEVFNKWLTMVDFPAVILLVMAIMGAWVVHQTQKNPNNNFDFADMLRDEMGKPSALRLALFPCLAVSSWVVMYTVVQTKTIDLWLIVFYMLVWSGAKIADKMVDAYIMTKGGGSALAAMQQQIAQQSAAQQPVVSPVTTAPVMGTIVGAGGLVLPLPKGTK